MSKNLLRFLKVITVEPAYFLYWAIYIILDGTNTNLLLQKKCRFNATFEPDLNTLCDDEKQGVLFATEMNSFYRFIMLFVCTFFSIFATSWSDEAGRRRRPLIFLPIIGQIIQALFGCLHSHFWSWMPQTAVYSNIIVEMMSGGIILMSLAGQMYIWDVSSVESRTMRMGMLLGARTLADLMGYGGSGFILRRIGFFYTYLFCFVSSIAALILALVFVRDISVQVDKKLSFSKIFSVMKIVDSFKVVFKKSLGRGRIVVVILLSIYTLISFATQGEKAILYLFLRYKFHWDEREFSTYIVYRYIGVAIGSVFCSIILSKILKIHDGIIGVFAGLWDTIAVIGYLFAYKTWHLYAVPIFDVFHGTALSVSLSFLSKFYKSDELGRLSSVTGMFTLLIPICHPVYNGIFEATLDTFPSAFFLSSISLDTIVVLLYCVSYFISQRLEKEKVVIEEEGKRMLDSK
ncbi:probable peptidoglycan muropeptide transporter SLC46 [Planococcus citri]|uniref:probable peptidoglycan muropeptide transporter SLC46 n=1 Tax=Planococcus citri TaxID=170843 RepID=UPI0031F9676D